MAGGIRFQDVHGAIVPDWEKSLIEAMRSGKVREPPISEEELSSRSKSDWVLKLVAICQITWFALQTFFRRAKHVPITALEMLTVAFVFCSIFIYAFCWNQPQDIEYPIVINQTSRQSDSTFADGQEIHYEQHQITDCDTDPDDVSQRRRSWPSSRHECAVDGAYREGFVEQLAPIADHSISHSALWNDGNTPSAYASGLMLQSESRNGTPLQNMDVSETSTIKHPYSDPNTVARLECIANAGGKHGCNRYQNRHQGSNSKISGERNPRSSISVIPEGTVVEINARVSDLEGVAKPSNSGLDARFADNEEISLLVLVLLGSLFGAIHCLAWNSPFPTSQERSAWRVCSVAATCLPSAFIFMARISKSISVSISSHRWLRFNNLVIISSYAMARITLIVLAFIALRALPADAYQTVNWNSYIPHFGA
ncbi:hypothetical protein N7G274_006543 [Stereocaulon virgatum]|uniref:Uncharacterized protein n=1 Tax=Stereocaulon virgatum TaxID=373712 RepID=A0ABR4A725_9LECA